MTQQFCFLGIYQKGLKANTQRNICNTTIILALFTIAKRWTHTKCLSTGVSVCAQSCLTLCDPTDCSPPGSSVHGIFQAKYWSELPFPLPGDLTNPGIQPTCPSVPALAGRFFTTEPPGKPMNRWMDNKCGTYILEDIILSEISQSPKDKYMRYLLLLLSHFCHVRLCATP